MKQKSDSIKRKQKIDTKKKELQKQIVKLDDKTGPLQLNAVPVIRHKKAISTIIQDSDFTPPTGDTNPNDFKSGGDVHYKSKRSISTVISHKSTPKLLAKINQNLDNLPLNDEIRGQKLEVVGQRNLHLPEIPSAKLKESASQVTFQTPRKSEVLAQDRPLNKTPRLKNVSSTPNIMVIQTLPGAFNPLESNSPLIDNLEEVNYFAEFGE